jgi:hypothetical protein
MNTIFQQILDEWSKLSVEYPDLVIWDYYMDEQQRAFINKKDPNDTTRYYTKIDGKLVLIESKYTFETNCKPIIPDAPIRKVDYIRGRLQDWFRESDLRRDLQVFNNN